MVVSLDTNVLIWGVKQQATPGQEHMIGRAKRFIEHLRADRIDVMLSTPVVAEYVGGFHPDNQAEQFKEIRGSFAVVPVDLRAAAIAAQLLYSKQLIKEIQNEYHCSRQVVKADMLIIATSVAAGAKTLYSHDGKFVKAAQGKIIVKPIPDLPAIGDQQSLFEGQADDEE